ncbi:hypothetical protein LG634_02135 [Streptomyces bambusae]|uniref:hypothetical protein n=1 Tax=Streptomyces bambusae TaxID=1550616 RepID=UPI001CFC72E6|nr:hypothetical protein [Streptomyces bambusae]MCB5163646.1 hypothetical protein [Streptomyces bambusae]
MTTTPQPGLPSPSELRRQARTEAGSFLDLPELSDPADALRDWTRRLAEAETPAQFHVLVDTVTGTHDSTLLALRDFLLTAGTWCREHGHARLGERYERTSDLLDVTDRLLHQLGVGHLAATWPGQAPTAPSPGRTPH